MASIGSR